MCFCLRLFSPSVFCEHLLEGAGTSGPGHFLTFLGHDTCHYGNLYTSMLVSRAQVPTEEDVLLVCQHSD